MPCLPYAAFGRNVSGLAEKSDMIAVVSVRRLRPRSASSRRSFTQNGRGEGTSPASYRWLRRLPAAFIGFGYRAERVRSPDAFRRR
ncbi:MAG TPA: hypothetical protein VGC35_08545 [Allosphingosinicella sp.]